MKEENVLTIDDVTGTIGAWMASDWINIPKAAVDCLKHAYDICVKEYEKK